MVADRVRGRPSEGVKGERPQAPPRVGHQDLVNFLARLVREVIAGNFSNNPVTVGTEG